MENAQSEFGKQSQRLTYPVYEVSHLIILKVPNKFHLFYIERKMMERM